MKGGSGAPPQPAYAVNAQQDIDKLSKGDLNERRCTLAGEAAQEKVAACEAFFAGPGTVTTVLAAPEAAQRSPAALAHANASRVRRTAACLCSTLSPKTAALTMMIFCRHIPSAMLRRVRLCVWLTLVPTRHSQAVDGTLQDSQTVYSHLC